MLKSTNKHKKYWKERKIDWKKSYTATWNHPHRDLIVWMLRQTPFYSLWEIGMGSGANIVRFMKDPVLKNRQYGGCDISEDAIKTAQDVLKGGMFHVESGDDMLLSDKSVDLALTDMMLIYVDPKDIRKYLKEMKRVTRRHILLVEFHHRSWWKRLKARFTSGYHVYNYHKLLAEMGFYDILVQHIPEQYWPADGNSEFRSIITAKIPE